MIASKYPWLDGIDLDKFRGDYVRAAKSIGAALLSPMHGSPSSSNVNTPGCVPFVTKEMSRHDAHPTDSR